MTFANFAKTSLSVGTIVVLSATMAHAGPLAFLNQFFVDIFTDISTFLTTIGAIAFIIAVIMMMFGMSNAWKIAGAAILFIIAVNAQNIIAALSGY